MTTVTQWFKGEINPAHVGRYQIKRPCMRGSGYPVKTVGFWNGSSWKHTDESSNGLYAGCSLSLSASGDCWRGVAK